jgi:hypothetical protein
MVHRIVALTKNKGCAMSVARSIAEESRAKIRDVGWDEDLGEAMPHDDRSATGLILRRTSVSAHGSQTIMSSADF